KLAPLMQLPPAERLIAATRLVQDELRYLGMEMGASGFVPHPPATVWKQRFGDCKDKALLLTTVLAELGIAATPALVATDWRGAVRELLPSPYVFDHAIVRAELGASVYWIDATASYQRGGLGELTPPDYEAALLVAPGVHEL